MNLLKTISQEISVTDYQVFKSRAFDQDISRIHAYLTRGNYYDSTIKEILETIYSDLKRLRTSPKIGSLLSVRTTIPNDYRYLVSGDYLIFYKIFESEKLVRIYHIYHGKENYLSKLKLHKHQSIYQTRQVFFDT